MTAFSPRPALPGFEEFVRASSADLLRAAYLLARDRGHAEDLVQTALLRTARRWSVAREAPLPYARKVLTNLAIDRTRGLRRRPSETTLQELAARGQDAPVEALLERHVLVAAIRNLAPRQRAVVVFRYLEDLSTAETAALLGCTEGTVKSTASRALTALRSHLGSLDEVDPDQEASHAH